MKTRYYLLSLAAVALLASCAKEMPAPVDNPGEAQFKTYLTVGIAPETKTHMEDNAGTSHKVFWSNGDKIAVNGTASETLAGLADDVQSTTFSFSGVLSTPYNVVYPSSIFSDATHVTLPEVQTFADGGFADGMFPMAGYSADGSSITISHLCAVLKISIKRATSGTIDEDNIVAVRFRGCNNEKVNGSFEIDYTAPALTAATGTGSETEVRVVKSQATSSTAIDYYLVVPAREYEHGFEIIVQDASGHIMTKSAGTSGGKTLVAGKLYTLPEFEFVPTDTELGVVIATASDLVNFAIAFNNKEYGEDVVATVTNDLVFDANTSADFNATNGIGQKKNVNGATEDNYFAGVFNGNGKTISGLQATVPVFAFTQTGSLIENLTLDNSCSLTIESTDENEVHGVLVGRSKGLVKNCTSNANVVIENAAKIATGSHHFGGLVGRNYGGTIKNCLVTGNITCSQTVTVAVDNQDNSTNAFYIGGIAGSNADSGSVTGSDFTGNITISDGNTYGGISATYTYNNGTKDVSGGLYFYIGGIVGYADNGTIKSCTSGIDGTARSIDARGTFVPAVGGILGWSKTSTSSEISNCNNYMTLAVASNGARTDTTPLRIGGIAARAAADIKNCNNSGPISSVSNSTTVYLGGIVADGINVSDCDNNSTGTITRTNAEASTGQTNRYIYMGGIMGANNTAGDVKNCNNKASITSNTTGTSTSTAIDMGGIVGSATKQIDIASCENTGQVTNTNSNNAVIARMALGGILGYGPIAATTIDDSHNKAQIYCNAQTKGDNRVSYSGGIAGLMGTIATGVDGLKISNCTNTARVWNRNYNTIANDVAKTPFGGGIVGAIIGTSTSQAYIHDCSTSDNDVVELRGYSGGIAGYAEAAVIEDDTVAQALTGSNANAQGLGGIVGWAVSSSISGCTTSGSINAVKNIGGLVAKLDTGSSIDGCKVDGATLTNGTNGAATAAAVLVSVAASGVNISDCGVKGTLNGAAITISSNMITTDGGATVTGTYLLP